MICDVSADSSNRYLGIFGRDYHLLRLGEGVRRGKIPEWLLKIPSTGRNQALEMAFENQYANFTDPKLGPNYI